MVAKKFSMCIWHIFHGQYSTCGHVDHFQYFVIYIAAHLLINTPLYTSNIISLGLIPINRITKYRLGIYSNYITKPFSSKLMYHLKICQYYMTERPFPHTSAHTGHYYLPIFANQIRKTFYYYFSKRLSTFSINIINNNQNTFFFLDTNE